MVQYILTPWRDRKELLLVRDQFYTTATPQHLNAPGVRVPLNLSDYALEPSQADDAQRLAVARVSMWMQRGNCPHLVESTALLTAAVLSDEVGGDAGGTYVVRAAYSAAFSR